jgi:glucose-6-phosphate isomerase
MLHLDVTGALAKSVTPAMGIPEQDYTGLRTTMKKHVESVQREREDGVLHAWTADPYNADAKDRCLEIAARVKKEKIQTVVWIGIGGSGLGPRVLQEAFEGPNTVEFLVLDTIDPAVLSVYLSIIDWSNALVVVVSKSGNTLETMSAFFLVWEELKKARGGRAASRAVAITDAKKGPLRAFCVEHGIESLTIPKDVGGRYCIFSPVGLLPLALLGADVDAFMKGGRDMDELTRGTHLEENPAALLAGTQFLLESKRGYLIRVIMPYVQRLQSLGRWNQQLIAESLGKDEAHNPFPLASIGTQDQHSLLQQWMEGPRKSWHLFIREADKTEVRIPKELPSPFLYMAGKSFGRLLDACYEGTAGALTSAKRPHATLTIDRVDAYNLGQLFFCLMMETVLLGKLYRLDPYGQPGVELGKAITKEILESE